MKKRKKFKKFIKTLINYSKGKNPKGLRVYKSDRKGKKIEILDKLELIEEI